MVNSIEINRSKDKRIILDVRNLKKYYQVTGGILGRTISEVKAVDDVSFTVAQGEVLGLVGESGCGKSTTGRAILRLIEPTAGKVFFSGRELTGLSGEEMRKIRRDMQIVFQDPYSSLNPRHTVEKILREPLIVHKIATKKEQQEKVDYLLEVVGLSSFHKKRYPHQFSGGQKQRIGIARALAVNPRLVIADEPVSALDVSIQSQILNLLQDLKEQFGLTYIFIAHDLSVVKHISDRVGVMYLGRVVELAAKQDLYQNPRHPYTQALLSAVPVINPDHRQERIILTGDVPSPATPPRGCGFHTRCPQCRDSCKTDRPPAKEVAAGHFVACHLY